MVNPPQMAFTAVPLTSQHPIEKVHVFASSFAPFTNTTLDRSAYKHKTKILELFLDIYFFRKKYLRQRSIDFDVCSLSSFGDVVYKELW